MTREGLINSDARAVFELLRKYTGGDRIFALTEITRLVQARLAAGESSRYRLDLARDEQRDTQPDRVDTVDLGDPDTRMINVDELLELRRKSTKE